MALTTQRGLSKGRVARPPLGFLVICVIRRAVLLSTSYETFFWGPAMRGGTIAFVTALALAVTPAIVYAQATGNGAGGAPGGGGAAGTAASGAAAGGIGTGAVIGGALAAAAV